MDPLTDRKKKIVEQERGFARDLACAVIELPRMNLWMIMIPVFLVYHIYRHKNAVKGRAAFVEHYLLSRVRSLDAAVEAVRQKRPPDIEAVMARAVDLPATARPAYREWITFLVQHHGDLLQAPGGDFKAWIQAVYRNRGTYLLHLNQLNRLENALNAALSNDMGEPARDVAETIARIEASSAELRRLQAEALF